MSKKTLFIVLNVLLFLFFLWIGLSNWGESDFSYEKESVEGLIIWEVRFPRIMAAFMVGALLAVSGYLIQLLVNNPLADPYLLGTASGASFGANLTLLGYLPLAAFGLYIPLLSAFVFAVFTTLFILFIANIKNRYNPLILILSGIGVSSFITAIVSLLIYFSSTSDQVKNVIFWTMGSFERVELNHIPILVLVLIMSLVVMSFYQKELQLMILGKERAESLGLNYQKMKNIIVLVSTLATSVAVAFAGVIGFVGLVIPHFVRIIYGAFGKNNLIISAILGGNLLLFCELFSRLIYPPVGFPVGVSTALLGVPVFIYILVKKNYQFGT